MQDHYVLLSKGTTKNTASTKAKADINKILLQSGFDPVYLDTKISKMQKLFFTNILVNKSLKNISNGTLIIQYPEFSQYMMERFIGRAKQKNIKVIALLHDVDSLRNMNNKSSEQEINYFNLCDGLIVHNDVMKNWLLRNGVHIPMVSLEIFDYLNPQKLITPTLSNKLVFAGNLVKADFLTKLNNDQLNVNIYGPNAKNNYPQGILFKGIYTSEELPAHLEGSFGLIWDGNLIETCGGSIGTYLKYNNPHKTSLYLSSGLPVIIWKDAAMAKFIVDNNLGLAVDSLEDVNRKIANISPQKYSQIVTNVSCLANQLRIGFYTKRAIKDIEALIN